MDALVCQMGSLHSGEDHAFNQGGYFGALLIWGSRMEKVCGWMHACRAPGRGAGGRLGMGVGKVKGTLCSEGYNACR